MKNEYDVVSVDESGLVNVCQSEVNGLDEIIVELESQAGEMSAKELSLVKNFSSTCQPAVEVESTAIVAKPVVKPVVVNSKPSGCQMIVNELSSASRTLVEAKIRQKTARRKLTYNIKKFVKKFNDEQRKSLETYLATDTFIPLNPETIREYLNVKDYFYDSPCYNTSPHNIFSEVCIKPTQEEENRYKEWWNKQGDFIRPLQEKFKAERKALEAQPVVKVFEADKDAVVMLSVKVINTAEPFKSLFAIQPKNLSDIADNMKSKGFDMSKPLVIWAEHSNTLLDGHTRLQAAELAGLLEVPVMWKHFEKEEDAYDYVVKCQVNRRNLTDAELLNIVSTLGKRGRGGISGISSTNPQPCGLPPTTAELAEKLNVSPRKIEQVKQINAKASPELLKEVDDGKKSINKACNEIKHTKKVEVKVSIVDEVFEYIMGKKLSTSQQGELIRRLVKAKPVELGFM